jgi:hypothetical protein
MGKLLERRAEIVAEPPWQRLGAEPVVDSCDLDETDACVEGVVKLGGCGMCNSGVFQFYAVCYIRQVRANPNCGWQPDFRAMMIITSDVII